MTAETITHLDIQMDRQIVGVERTQVAAGAGETGTFYSLGFIALIRNSYPDLNRAKGKRF